MDTAGKLECEFTNTDLLERATLLTLANACLIDLGMINAIAITETPNYLDFMPYIDGMFKRIYGFGCGEQEFNKVITPDEKYKTKNYEARRAYGQDSGGWVNETLLFVTPDEIRNYRKKSEKEKDIYADELRSLRSIFDLCVSYKNKKSNIPDKLEVISNTQKAVIDMLDIRYLLYKKNDIRELHNKISHLTYCINNESLKGICKQIFNERESAKDSRGEIVKVPKLSFLSENFYITQRNVLAEFRALIEIFTYDKIKNFLDFIENTAEKDQTNEKSRVFENIQGFIDEYGKTGDIQPLRSKLLSLDCIDILNLCNDFGADKDEDALTSTDLKAIRNAIQHVKFSYLTGGSEINYHSYFKNNPICKEFIKSVNPLKENRDLLEAITPYLHPDSSSAAKPPAALMEQIADELVGKPAGVDAGTLSGVGKRVVVPEKTAWAKPVVKAVCVLAIIASVFLGYSALEWKWERDEQVRIAQAEAAFRKNLDDGMTELGNRMHDGKNAFKEHKDVLKLVAPAHELAAKAGSGHSDIAFAAYRYAAEACLDVAEKKDGLDAPDQKSLLKEARLDMASMKNHVNGNGERQHSLETLQEQSRKVEEALSAAEKEELLARWEKFQQEDKTIESIIKVKIETHEEMKHTKIPRDKQFEILAEISGESLKSAKEAETIAGMAEMLNVRSIAVSAHKKAAVYSIRSAMYATDVQETSMSEKCISYLNSADRSVQKLRSLVGADEHGDIAFINETTRIVNASRGFFDSLLYRNKVSEEKIQGKNPASMEDYVATAFAYIEIAISFERSNVNALAFQQRNYGLRCYFDAVSDLYEGLIFLRSNEDEKHVGELLSYAEANLLEMKKIADPENAEDASIIEKAERSIAFERNLGKIRTLIRDMSTEKNIDSKYEKVQQIKLLIPDLAASVEAYSLLDENIIENLLKFIAPIEYTYLEFARLQNKDKFIERGDSANQESPFWEKLRKRSRSRIQRQLEIVSRLELEAKSAKEKGNQEYDDILEEKQGENELLQHYYSFTGAPQEMLDEHQQKRMAVEEQLNAAAPDESPSLKEELKELDEGFLDAVYPLQGKN